MGITAREGHPYADDAARRAREGETSFERFVVKHNPYRDEPHKGLLRSVSDSEGIAAFALLACGQQGQSSSRSTSREHVGSSNPRVDSGTWPDLLAAGGEIVPTPGSNAGGGTTSNLATGSVGGKDTLSNDPGPMPPLPPFGGYQPSGANGSRSRSGSSDSRTGPLRTGRDANSLTFSFAGYTNISGVSWNGAAVVLSDRKSVV